jgi:transposase
VGVKRKQYSEVFKARVTMAALPAEKTLAELWPDFGVHPTMISTWKQQLMKRASELFARGNKAPAANGLEQRHQINTRLAVERLTAAEQDISFIRRNCTKIGKMMLQRHSTDIQSAGKQFDAVL